MGWASGSSVMRGIIEAAETSIYDLKIRCNFYKKVIEVLEQEDWDTQGECMEEDEAFDKALKELHPDWFDEEMDEDEKDNPSH